MAVELMISVQSAPFGTIALLIALLERRSRPQAALSFPSIVRFSFITLITALYFSIAALLFDLR